ncbi:hypothetical protein ebA2614 [Aromatoleum aromaticum EbN1]|uniref:Uncharacterized protein n=1 Tax=Aromatoleum aromaticum (strain DSM 19018 / LMG 30748 / EbN1) TaxID=76114 RepID=Q5P518_AROAE|nr:hypothetical protein ebA2614 [Aromatoleum aromaticum EbN1]
MTRRPATRGRLQTGRNESMRRLRSWSSRRVATSPGTPSVSNTEPASWSPDSSVSGNSIVMPRNCAARDRRFALPRVSHLHSM